MTIEAVVFDIGGVLEITPATGWQERWATKLRINTCDIEARLGPAFAGGATAGMHAIKLESTEQAISELQVLLDS